MKAKDVIPARLPALLRAERELEQALATVRREIDALVDESQMAVPDSDRQRKPSALH